MPIDRVMDEDLCRICGARVVIWELRDAQRGGGCIRCDGSPLCSRCGHPRKEHVGVFNTTSRKGCTTKIPIPDGLAAGRCGCDGYIAATGRLAQASFATDDVPIVDIVIPKLRIASPPESGLRPPAS